MIRKTTQARIVGAVLAVSALTVVQADSPDAARAAITVTVPGCEVNPDDVVAWWRGEDNLVAEVGPDLTGNVPFTTGTVGRAMNLGGPTTTNTATTTQLPTLDNQITIETWIKPTPTGQTQTIISRWSFIGGNKDDAYILLIGPTGELEFRTDDPSSRWPTRLTVTANNLPNLFDGNFHHIAATRSPTTTALYYNGNLAATSPSRGATLNPATTTPVQLGSSSGRGNPFWYHGTLDEPTIWRRALTANEIDRIVLAGPAGKCPVIPIQRAKLLDPAGGAGDFFGYSVAVDAVTAVAGSPYSDTFSGSVHTFVRSGLTWSPEQIVTAGDAFITDFFGWSVDIVDDTMVVGAPGVSGDAGAAYVFTRSGAAWTQQAKLTASDGAPVDNFGYSVSIDGNTIIVGAQNADQTGGANQSGAVYVFELIGGVWGQTAKLTAADAATGDAFGAFAEISGAQVVVGSPFDDDAGTSSGAAYVFDRDPTTGWSQVAKLVADDAAAGDTFGSSASIDAERVVIGASLADEMAIDSGAAYVFESAATVWTQRVKLVPLGAAAGDHFGSAVAVSGPTVVVGSDGDDDAGNRSGAAHVFTELAATWSETTKLLGSDTTAEDQFGFAVDIDAFTINVGAYLDDDRGNNSGSVYVFGT